MKPAATDPPAPTGQDAGDPFQAAIRVVRERRRTVELALQDGQLVARVPKRISQRELQRTLPALRDSLWGQLRRRNVFDDAALHRRAEQVAATHLSDQRLPSFTVRFSTRQQKRWGSCTVGRTAGGQLAGSIRISARLRGHPGWLLDHLLLHELAHLVVIDHGPRFQQLMRRSPQYERAEGYLEALVQLEQLGILPCRDEPAVAPTAAERAPLPLFAALEIGEAAASAAAPSTGASSVTQRRAAADQT